jgi:oxygen-independent coproporphyrinogen-3 oxidase
MERMMDCLITEIQLQRARINENPSVETIYVGGGTPSMIPARFLEKIISTVRLAFDVIKQAEITLEANPEDLQDDVIAGWKKAGFNRVSLGIQSIQDDELHWMNRNHTAAEALAGIDRLITGGFSNLSADVIFGSHLCSDEALLSLVNRLIEKKIPHLSCYALTVEEKTWLHRQVRQSPEKSPDPETQHRQFYLLSDHLQAHGYGHYEISNYALPGMESQHNSHYWKKKAYWGMGPSAHGYNGSDRRWWNIANNALYMQSIESGIIPVEEELLTMGQQFNEAIMIGLRTAAGVSLQELHTIADDATMNHLLKQSKSYVEAGLLRITTDGFMQLTRAGKIRADGIAADLFTE